MTQYSLKDFIDEVLNHEDRLMLEDYYFSRFSPSIKSLKGTELQEYIDSKKKDIKFLSRLVYFYTSGYHLVALVESLQTTNTDQINNYYKNVLEHTFKEVKKYAVGKYNIKHICNLCKENEMKHLNPNDSMYNTLKEAINRRVAEAYFILKDYCEEYNHDASE